MEKSETNHGHERWQQPLQELRADLSDAEQDIEVLQDWRITHMSICHPKILGRLAIIFGVSTGVALVIGYVLGTLMPLWRP